MESGKGTISKILIGLIGISLLSSALFPATAFAQEEQRQIDPLNSVEVTAGEGGIKTQGDLTTITGRVIGSALAILGTVFLLLIIIGGFMWMTSAGNQDKIGRAKSMIIASMIGLVIIVISYYITQILYLIFSGRT